MQLPQMIRIRQSIQAPVVKDIALDIGAQVERLALENKVTRGATVAVACSSRGIANYDIIVKSTLEALKRLGLVPFLVPAMGSHGSASAAGQQKVLENYGLGQENTGAPIRSSLEVVDWGQTPEGVTVYVDRMAAEADHIVLINRVKSHTEFEFEIESGLMKMMAIGLGKETGAAHYHRAIMRCGQYPQVIVPVARKVLASGKVLFGVGVVENGYAQTARVRVLPADMLEAGEKELLREAKRLTLRLPFEEVDVLVVDEMGKDISGTGFDSKVVGRILMPLVAQEPESPRVKRIVVCDLTARTEGNADGVGLADFVTQRLVDKIDLKALYVNAIAGTEPEHAKIPLTLKNDREALQVALDSIGRIPLDEVRVMRVKNTLALKTVDISSAYADQLKSRNDLETVAPRRPMAFDGQGNLAAFDDL